MRGRGIDLTGQVFGLLTVKRWTGTSIRSNYAWECVCECGKTHIVASGKLRAGEAKSCGCRKGKYTHGLCGTRIYTIWQNMMARCYSSYATQYADYGGRGIAVCDRWHDAALFYEDMGEPPTKHSIDRRDNNGDYTPENCYWATKREQQQNRRVNRLITAFGQTKTLSAWAEESGLHFMTLSRRLKAGWPPESAVTLPPTGKKFKR